MWRRWSYSSAMWAGLIVTSALPLPISFSLNFDPLQHLPLVLLWLFGGIALALFLWRIEPWLCLPVVWSAVKAILLGLPPRSIEVLGLLVLSAILYGLALEMKSSTERMVAHGILLAAGVNAVLGVLNIVGIYPGLIVKEGFMYWPVGLLSHPNYWGLYLAMAYPVAWALLGERLNGAQILYFTVVWYALIFSSRSRLPVLVSLIPLFVIWMRGRSRQLVAVSGVGMLAGILLVRDWSSTLTLGGRVRPWVLGLSEWWTVAPWTGIGPGMWRNWVLWPEGVMVQTYGASSAVFTEAFNEPLQVLFELGLIGVIVWGLFAARCLLDATVAVQSDDRIQQAWGMVVLMAGVAMWLTNLFHWPAQAMIVLFAAARIRACWAGR